ncbi:hypothetical protein PAXINDRAFT_101811 [Paxillus involutus ATCC 200175]|uniref:Unplaced genomic scaffold PAXINscaffold_65, whole genome shotgun sequence n=1 Tax=Paxillus involutus ATCC 200175 TaxID=664439 RepID=A0A0C9T5V3_PAXIN|nr:hypothetical protein PAXINDRAFT_101811 [Paxillus involutus ATCC 200175]
MNIDTDVREIATPKAKPSTPKAQKSELAQLQEGSQVEQGNAGDGDDTKNPHVVTVVSWAKPEHIHMTDTLLTLIEDSVTWKGAWKKSYQSLIHHCDDIAVAFFLTGDKDSKWTLNDIKMLKVVIENRVSARGVPRRMTWKLGRRAGPRTMPRSRDGADELDDSDGELVRKVEEDNTLIATTMVHVTAASAAAVTAYRLFPSTERRRLRPFKLGHNEYSKADDMEAGPLRKAWNYASMGVYELAGCDDLDGELARQVEDHRDILNFSDGAPEYLAHDVRKTTPGSPRPRHSCRRRGRDSALSFLIDREKKVETLQVGT